MRSPPTAYGVTLARSNGPPIPLVYGAIDAPPTRSCRGVDPSFFPMRRSYRLRLIVWLGRRTLATISIRAALDGDSHRFSQPTSSVPSLASCLRRLSPPRCALAFLLPPANDNGAAPPTPQASPYPPANDNGAVPMMETTSTLSLSASLADGALKTGGRPLAIGMSPSSPRSSPGFRGSGRAPSPPPRPPVLPLPPGTLPADPSSSVVGDGSCSTCSW